MLCLCDVFVADPEECGCIDDPAADGCYIDDGGTCACGPLDCAIDPLDGVTCLCDGVIAEPELCEAPVCEIGPDGETCVCDGMVADHEMCGCAPNPLLPGCFCDGMVEIDPWLCDESCFFGPDDVCRCASVHVDPMFCGLPACVVDAEGATCRCGGLEYDFEVTTDGCLCGDQRLAPTPEAPPLLCTCGGFPVNPILCS